MLLFIRCWKFVVQYPWLISIHLMLLFINGKKRIVNRKVLFQYISCYCLSITGQNIRMCNEISIHLMLLFIPIRIPSFLISTSDFNTSHVTVYPITGFLDGINIEFQYISCYCLSNELTPFYIFLRI